MIDRGRDIVQPGLLEECATFLDLIRSLGDTEWAAPSRCEGWTAGDVAGHVVGTVVNIVNGDLDGIGTHEANERQVAERRGLTAAEVAKEFEGSLGGFSELLAGFDDETWAMPGIGDQLAGLWYGVFVHADDVRHAAGRDSVAAGEGLTNAVAEVADALERNGWGPATLALDGLPEIDIGTGGRRVTGDPLTFVLAATGRTDPAGIGLDDNVNIYA